MVSIKRQLPVHATEENRLTSTDSHIYKLLEGFLKKQWMCIFFLTVFQPSSQSMVKLTFCVCGSRGAQLTLSWKLMGSNSGSVSPCEPLRLCVYPEVERLQHF